MLFTNNMKKSQINKKLFEEIDFQIQKGCLLKEVRKESKNQKKQKKQKKKVNRFKSILVQEN